MTRQLHTCLVCSGGGVYGAVQAGMLCELAERGYRPDVIVGVSAGALNGAYLSAGFTAERANALASIWESLGKRSVFPARPVSQVLRVARGQGALHPDDGLRDLIAKVCPIDDLAEAAIPLHVGAVDVLTGELVFWDRGRAVERLLASAALPGVISPVHVDGRAYFDGGVISPIPVRHATGLDCDRIIVLDVSGTSRPRTAPTTALATLLTAFGHARSEIHRLEQIVMSRNLDIVTISGDMPQVGPNDFQRGQELVAAGRSIARDALTAQPGILDRSSRRGRLTALFRERRSRRSRT